MVERLASYPSYVQAVDAWHAPAIAKRVRMLVDASGLARTDAWSPGRATNPPSVLANINTAQRTSLERALLVEQDRELSIGHM